MKRLLTRMKAIPILTALLITVSILSACGDTVTSQEIDLSNYPESVQNNTVSVEYYEQVKEFYSKGLPNIELFEEIMEIQSGDISVIYNEDFAKNFIDSTNHFDGILNDLKFKPKTEADEKIHFQLDKVIFMQLKLNQYEKELLETKNLDITANIVASNAIVRNILEDFYDVTAEYGISN